METITEELITSERLHEAGWVGYRYLYEGKSVAGNTYHLHKNNGEGGMSLAPAGEPEKGIEVSKMGELPAVVPPDWGSLKGFPWHQVGVKWPPNNLNVFVISADLEIGTGLVQHTKNGPQWLVDFGDGVYKKPVAWSLPPRFPSVR